MRQNDIGMTLDKRAIANLVVAARDAAPVSGLTHTFYRYPARFSPTFARAAILAFSKPGDWVLDPFAGGGTALVEAAASGRNAIGIDISELATFVCEAKTILLSDDDVGVLRNWACQLPKRINMRSPGHHFVEYASAGYYRNITGRSYWRLRKAIEQALRAAIHLPNRRAQTFARSVILRTAQWALDSRKIRPSVPDFRQELVRQAVVMLTAALDYRARLGQKTENPSPEVICLNRSAAGLEHDPIMGRVASPKLVVTSPPYPGIHVLYHRWQVDGRKETPAAFWIANRFDGAGSSYYTLGDRKNPELRTYFRGLETNFRSIANVSGPKTTLVQVVAFSEPEWQLPRYLEVMETCGFCELRPWDFQDDSDGRLWREVPNRKWHARQKDRNPGSREVVLVHRKKEKSIQPPQVLRRLLLRRVRHPMR